jgi:hypothetical protein
MNIGSPPVIRPSAKREGERAMNEIDRLSAIEAIKQLKARYCRCVDTKQWPEFRTLFTDDAHLEFPHANYVSDDPDEFVEMVGSAFTAEWVTMHHCHNPEIKLISESEATGIWAMEDRNILPSGEAPVTHLGYGYYHERYLKRNDAWLISNLRLTYLRHGTPDHASGVDPASRDVAIGRREAS